MFKNTWVFATLLALSLSVLVGVTSRHADAAAPADGVYDVAVLDEGDSFDWQDNDFQALSASEYDWEMIQPGDLTSSNLENFDVLIIPWNHDYGWLTAPMAAAIMDFVDGGGTLIIHSLNTSEEPCEICDAALPDGFADALLTFFPSEYFIDWVSSEEESVRIINPNHPLASRPNMLTEEGLTDWGNSIHSYIVAWGSAWQWVLATDFLEFDDEEEPDFEAANSQGGQLSAQAIEPGVDEAMVQGCAPFGEGIIVVSGQDPEYHGTNEDEGDLEAEALLQIENEIKIGAAGCGNRPSRDRVERQQPPNIGAGLSGLFNGMPTPLPTAPSAVAPAATAPVITPPRTGDAGLAESTSTPLYGVAAAGFVLAAISVHRLLRR